MTASKEPAEEAGDQQLDTVVEIKDALDETPGRLLLQADGWGRPRYQLDSVRL